MKWEQRGIGRESWGTHAVYPRPFMVVAHLHNVGGNVCYEHHPTTSKLQPDRTLITCLHTFPLSLFFSLGPHFAPPPFLVSQPDPGSSMPRPMSLLWVSAFSLWPSCFSFGPSPLWLQVKGASAPKYTLSRSKEGRESRWLNGSREREDEKQRRVLSGTPERCGQLGLGPGMRTEKGHHDIGSHLFAVTH